MFKWLRLSTLKQQFSFSAILIIVGLGVFINTAFYFIYQQEMERDTRQQLVEKLNLQSVYINRWMDERMLDVRQMALREGVMRLDQSSMKRDFEVFVQGQNDFSDIAFVNTEGIIEVDASFASGTNIRDRGYFQHVMKGREWISEVTANKISGEPVIVFTVPVYSYHKELRGAIVGMMKLDAIDRTLQKVYFGNKGEQYLLDSDGYFIGNPHVKMYSNYWSIQMKSTIWNRAMNDLMESSVYTNFQGEKVFGAYEWMHDRRWVLIAEVKRSEVYDSLFNITFVIGMITVFFVIISFYGVMAVTRRVERPLEFLLQGTKVIKEGNYDYRIDSSVFRRAPIELRELCDTFNLMSRKLRSTIHLLEERAMIDVLTELHNRRYLLQEGGKLVENCIQAEQNCSAMMIDVDHFKQVNDRYGHVVGDRVLHYTAEVLKRLVGTEALLARYGGEEFIVLLQRKTVEETNDLAEEIRQEMERTSYEEESLRIPLTISAGVAAWEEIEQSSVDSRPPLEILIENADRALYQAKQNGRNRVERG